MVKYKVGYVKLHKNSSIYKQVLIPVEVVSTGQTDIDIVNSVVNYTQNSVSAVVDKTKTS